MFVSTCAHGHKTKLTEEGIQRHGNQMLPRREGQKINSLGSVKQTQVEINTERVFEMCSHLYRYLMSCSLYYVKHILCWLKCGKYYIASTVYL